MKNSLKSSMLASIIAFGSTLTCMPALAQFGLPSLPGASKSSGTAADPDAFIKSAKAAESLMNNSVGYLAAALASKENAAKIAEIQKAANATTNPEEKKAKQAELEKSQLAAVNEAGSNAQFKSDIGKMDAKKKENLGAAAFNFMLALLKDKDLIDQSQGIISGVSSNPANLGKVGSLKDAVSSLSNQMTAASQISGKITDIMSVVSVKAPASKDEKPKTTAEVTGE